MEQRINVQLLFTTILQKAKLKYLSGKGCHLSRLSFFVRFYSWYLYCFSMVFMNAPHLEKQKRTSIEEG
jgi:hypothetical protein